MMIATMSDRADRRNIVGIPGPNYYTSGTNIMSPKALGFKAWEDLRGKKVCGKQGAFYNQITEERYGVEIVAFTGNAEAKQALRDRKCVAWVYDDSSIGSDLASGNWDDFEMHWHLKTTIHGVLVFRWQKRIVYLVISCQACSTIGTVQAI